MQNAAVGRGPLEGVKVLDLTAVVSGPFATMWLADQGAEVLKVEPPALGDQGRYVGAGFLGYSALFATCNRNKRSLAIDLRDPEGLALVRRLAAEVDVLIENFRPGVADRLGLGYEAVRAVAPDIIYASINGYGFDGPYVERRTYDSIMQAATGLADMQSGADGEPSLVYSIICDKVAGLAAAQAITAALFQRSRGGGGQKLSVSMLESNLAFNWPDVMWNDTFVGEDFQRGLTISDTYRLWPTRDGHVAVVFISGRAFDDWCVALDAPPEIAGETFATEADSRLRWRELWPFWEARMRSYATDDLLARFHAAGVPAGALIRREDICNDPQVQHVGAVVEVEHPTRGPMRQSRPAARFAGQDAPKPTPAPELGQHSTQVLAGLGLDAAEIDRLLAAGIVRGAA